MLLWLDLGFLVISRDQATFFLLLSFDPFNRIFSKKMLKTIHIINKSAILVGQIVPAREATFY